VTTEKLYRDDPYLLEFDARLVASRSHEGREAVILDRTAFYAESGGQPWDTGSLAGVPVVAVVEEPDGAILHVLAAPLAAGAGETVHGRVDAERRRDHRQQHHGQHLLSRAFVDTAGARTVSFHLGAEESSIDLNREVSREQVLAAEARTNAVVWEARAVRVRTVSPEEARAAGVEPPAEAKGGVRLVEADGFDLQPCGGTHPRSTAEVGVVLVTGHERYKGGSRVRFVCGHRALAAFDVRRQALERLGTLFSASLDGLTAAAERSQEQLAEAQRRCRDLAERALEGEARRLLAEAETSPALVVACYDGWPAADLRGLANALVAVGPCVALLGSREDKAHLVFAQSPGLPHDVPGLLREAVALVEGRGGGKGDVAQGGGPRVERLQEALDRAAAAVRERA
jgi:alanyl-tRNA synthetase